MVLSHEFPNNAVHYKNHAKLTIVLKAKRPATLQGVVNLTIF
jgi:hypothetical protein